MKAKRLFGEGLMTEERAQHPQEPAEGSPEDIRASGAEGPEKEEGEGSIEDAPKPGQHPQEPAEGSKEDVEARGAEGPAEDSA